MDVAPPNVRPLDFPLFHPWRRQGRAYRQVRWFLRTYLTTCHRFQMTGREKVPLEGPLILAGNHPSLLDPPCLFVACPRRIAFLSAEWTFQVPGLRRVMKGTGMIMVERNKGGAPALRAALRLLQAGWAVGIYPHGALVAEGEAKEMKTGVIQMAAMSGARIVPVRTFGTEVALPKGKIFARPGPPVRIVFGDPLTISLSRLELKDPERMKIEADRLFDAIMGLQ